MAKDYVADFSLEFEGVVSLDELYKYTQRVLHQRRYDTKEPGYREVQQGKKRTMFWFCEAERNINDYIKDRIDIFFTVRDAEAVKAKKKNTLQGALSIKVKGFIEKDYEKRWNWNPVIFFLREIKDKFGGSQMSKAEAVLKEDARWLVNELKAYLNVQLR